VHKIQIDLTDRWGQTAGFLLPPPPPPRLLASLLLPIFTKRTPNPHLLVPLSPAPLLLKAVSQPDGASTSTAPQQWWLPPPHKSHHSRFSACSPRLGFLPLQSRGRGAAGDMATGEWELREEDDYEFDLDNPFTSPADEPIASLLDAEGHHAPSVSAAASAARRDAAAFISKVRGGTRPPPHSLLLLSGFLFGSFRCFLTRSASIRVVRSRCGSAGSSPSTRASPTSRSTTWIASSPSANCPYELARE
jgi:hypothetical protein